MLGQILRSETRHEVTMEGREIHEALRDGQKHNTMRVDSCVIGIEHRI